MIVMGLFGGCAQKVEVGEGEAFTSGDGKWKTRHISGQCPITDQEEPF